LEKGKNKLEKERQKEDKERNESRISMIMNRKWGKVYINVGCLQLTSLTPYHFFQTFHVRPILAITKNSTWRKRVSINQYNVLKPHEL